MYKYIKDPKTLKNVSIYSKIGYKILKSYLNTINQLGGAWLMANGDLWEEGHIISYNGGFGILADIEDSIVLLNSPPNSIDISNCINITLNPPQEIELNTWYMPNSETWEINHLVLYNGNLGTIINIDENGFITLSIDNQIVSVAYSQCSNTFNFFRITIPNGEVWEINHSIICRGDWGYIVNIDKFHNITFKNGENIFYAPAPYNDCINMTLNHLKVEGQEIIKSTIYLWSELKKKNVEDLYMILRQLNADLRSIDFNEPNIKDLLLDIIKSNYLLDDSQMSCVDIIDGQLEIFNMDSDNLYELAKSYGINITEFKENPSKIEILRGLVMCEMEEDKPYKSQKYIVVKTVLNQQHSLVPLRVRRASASEDDFQYNQYLDLMKKQQQPIKIEDILEKQPPVVVIHGHGSDHLLSPDNQHRYNVLFSTPLHCSSWPVPENLIQYLQKCFVTPNSLSSAYSIYHLWRTDDIGDSLRSMLGLQLTPEDLGRSTGIELTLGFNPRNSGIIDLGAIDKTGQPTPNYSAIVIVMADRTKDITKEVLNQLGFKYKELQVGPTMQYFNNIEEAYQPITVTLKQIEESIKILLGQEPILISFGCRGKTTFVSSAQPDLSTSQSIDVSPDEDFLEGVDLDALLTDLDDGFQKQDDDENDLQMGTPPLVDDNF